MNKFLVKIYSSLVLSFAIFIFIANSALAITCNIKGHLYRDMGQIECTNMGGEITDLESSPNYDSTRYFQGDDIGTYIKSIYKYAIGVVGIIATIVIMIGGLIWITSMGNAQRVSSAKDWIGGALTGLALAMFSYTLLWIINPDLVNFKPVNPDKIEVKNSPSALPCATLGNACDFGPCCAGLHCGPDTLCVRSPGECRLPGAQCGPNTASCCYGLCTNGVCPDHTGYISNQVGF